MSAREDGRAVAPAAARAASLVALALGLYHLYVAIAGTPPALVHRATHFSGMALVAYLTLAAGASARRSAWLAAAGLLAATTGLYLVVAFDGMVLRVGVPSTLDLAMATVLLVVLLDLTRRLHGWPLVVTAAVFLAYALAGPIVPGLLAHRGFSPADVLEFLYATTEGIFGVPLQVSATYIVVFIMFAAFLERSGIIALFNDIAFAVAGRTRGGVAKVAVLSSALMGTVNGSGLANVTTTGAMTIPMMTRHGFPPHFAGGVEATASMGGQIMPPVMGVAAFLMAERLGMPYSRIALAATVPAILYFVAITVQIHLHAARRGMRVLDAAGAPSISSLLLARGYLLLPVVVLVWLMLAGYSPVYAAVTSIGATIGLSWAAAGALAAWAPPGARRAALARALNERGASPLRLLEAIEAGIHNTVSVAVACAVVGIIVGVVTLTGFGLKLSGAIIAAAAGLLLPTLVLTMIACFVLGMGLPTIPTYIITSTMAAPALIRLGVDRLAADFFVMYFGVLANITPPVALAAYAAAGIARADPLKTCLTAVRLSVAGFIVPYIFVYSPIMLGVGFAPLPMLHVVLTALVGVAALGAAMEGYAWRAATRSERLLLAAAAVTLIVPGWVTDAVGAALLGAFLFLHRRRSAIPGPIERVS
jgi:TRAP transporter 4TM/12TM fusion protein